MFTTLKANIERSQRERSRLQQGKRRGRGWAGPHLDGHSLYRCLEDFEVTSSAAVPTIWLGLLQYLRDNQLRPTTLKRTLVGGTSSRAASIFSVEPCRT